MPTPTSRPSLTINLEDRYSTTSVGGAFNVQKTLGSPGTVPSAQKVIEGDTNSMNANTFQSPAGFETNMRQSQFLEVQSNGTTGLSRLIKGFNNTPYDK